MFKQLASFTATYENYMTKRSRIEAHRILMAQDDKTLQDIGIDRYELTGGIKNWPWNGETTAQQSTQAPSAKSRAIRELSSYTDRELHDLGINRGMIADAVANGRPGIDDVAAKQPAPAPVEVRRARAA